jgi:hypothetical protein
MVPCQRAFALLGGAREPALGDADPGATLPDGIDLNLWPSATAQLLPVPLP